MLNGRLAFDSFMGLHILWDLWDNQDFVPAVAKVPQNKLFLSISLVYSRFSHSFTQAALFYKSNF